MKTLIACTFAALIIHSVSLLIGFNWLNAKQSVRCTVLEKYPAEHVGKYKSYSEFILVLKRTDDGHVFDVKVTPSAFYLANINDNLMLALRPTEMGQLNDVRDKRLFYFIAVMIAGALAVCIVPLYMLTFKQ